MLYIIQEFIHLQSREKEIILSATDSPMDIQPRLGHHTPYVHNGVGYLLGDLDLDV